MRAWPIETPDGVFLAYFSEAGLAQLRFPEQGDSSDVPVNASGANARTDEWLRITASAVREVLAGRPPAALPPFDLSPGTAFQQQVWKVISSIPTGETLSYGEVADRIGAPRAVRAVGGACGANPIPVLIPCHRVLARNQRLGGFSGGLHWKKLLLERETQACFAFAAKNS